MGQSCYPDLPAVQAGLHAMAFRVHNRLSGASFEVRADESILDAAMRAGRVLPYSCRFGSCAACKATLISGSVDYGSYEARALTGDEIKAGKLLLCQARPLEDVTIEAHEVDGAVALSIRTLPCRVTRMRRLAHDVMALHLALPPGQVLDYVAGQYIDILLRGGRRRSFSLAGRPGGAKELEIHVRHVPGGRFTSHVFGSMKERDLLRFEGPFGTFFLRTDSDDPVILMAGGTGLAPMKSMIEDAIAKGYRRSMHLFWGVRALRDLYMHELVGQWTRALPCLRYTPVLSEAQPGDRWSGRTGLVHQAVIDAYPDLSGFEVYASGPPPMIDAAKTVFPRHRIRGERFYYDSFEFAENPPPSR